MAMSPYLSPYMQTDEDRIRAALMRQRGPITMESQVNAQLQTLDPSNMPEIQPTPLSERLMMPPEQDFSGEESSIANQRAYANQLRGRELPRGRSVGPSGIYTQNPWEAAEVGFSRALGGYLSGKADDRAEALGERKRQSALARAKRQAEIDAMAEQQRRSEREQGLRTAARERDFGIRERQTEREAAAAEAAADRAAQAQENAADRALAERELRMQRESYINPETGEAITVAGDDPVPEGAVSVDAYEALIEAGELTPGESDFLAGYDNATRAAIEKMGSASEREAARESLVALDGLNHAMEVAEKAYKEGADWTGGADVVAGLVTDVFGEEAKPSVRNFMRGLFRDENELNVKAAITESYEKLRRAATGANLTGVEIAFSSDYDPSTPGISEEQALQRLQFVARRVNDGLRARGIPERPLYEIDTSLFEDNDRATTRRDVQERRSQRPLADMTEDEFLALPPEEQEALLNAQ